MIHSWWARRRPCRRSWAPSGGGFSRPAANISPAAVTASCQRFQRRPVANVSRPQVSLQRRDTRRDTASISAVAETQTDQQFEYSGVPIASGYRPADSVCPAAAVPTSSQPPQPGQSAASVRTASRLSQDSQPPQSGQPAVSARTASRLSQDSQPPQPGQPAASARTASRGPRPAGEPQGLITLTAAAGCGGWAEFYRGGAGVVSGGLLCRPPAGSRV